MRLSLALILLLVSFSVLAKWSYTESTHDSTWIVKNGRAGGPSTVEIEVKNEREAKKLSKKLNELEKEDNEEE
ncbi:MAG: hypothetical protein ACR2PH_05210 [Desulfobulbia bacterium]